MRIYYQIDSKKYYPGNVYYMDLENNKIKFIATEENFAEATTNPRRMSFKVNLDDVWRVEMLVDDIGIEE